MAVIYEELEGNLIRAYSNIGMMIHGGSPEADYAEAVDPADMHRTYTETDIPIDSDEEPTDEEYAQVGRIMMGVEP